MKSLSVLLVGLSLGFYACVEEGKKAVSQPENLEKKEEKAKPVQQLKAPISSPEKMFGYIHNQGVNYSKELMNDPKDAEQYLTPHEKALNFGVYTTDLAYAAAYQDIELTVDLYKTVKRLSSELDIAEVMNPEMVEQMQANMENPDSLAVVAGQAYYQAVAFLEDNRQSGKLALMSVGGWIESLYITMYAVEGDEHLGNTKLKVAEQKVIFENLYAYLKEHQKELDVEKAMQSLQAIAKIYTQLSADENSEQIQISEDQYTQLKKAVADYRNQIIAVE